MGTINEKLLSAKEAADYLRITVGYLYKKTMKGEIRFYKPGGKKLYFLKSDLDDWITGDAEVRGNENQEIGNAK